MSKLIDRLAVEYRSLCDQYDAVLSTCDVENRDPDPVEAAQLDQLRSEMDPLGSRLMELKETEDRRWAAVRAMSDAPAGEGGSGLVHVRSEPEVYHQGNQGELSFFRDLLHAQVDGDPECRSRIDRHRMMNRAAATTTTGTGVIPPTWLFNEFAMLQHGARPWADTLRRVGIENANPVNIGKQVTPGAAPAAQAGENTAPADGSFNASIITTQPVTYTGKVDVSRQLIDGSNPSIDGLVYADCMGAYNELIEQAVVSAFEAASGFAASITYPGTAPAYTNMFDAFVDGGASVNKHRKMPAHAVFCSIGAFAFLQKMKDTAGRPLMVTGSAGGPFNAYGAAATTQVLTGVAGEAVGLAIVPSWAGVDNHLYVLKVDDSLLLESSTFNFRYEEVLGPSTIRLGVWGYAAPVIGRYPLSFAKIDAGTTIPAPQEAEVEAEGTAKAKK